MAMYRADPLENDEVYHVMNKSIAGYKIFSNEKDYQRFLQGLRYFSIDEPLPKLSEFLERSDVNQIGFERCLQEYFDNAKQCIQIIAYCLMPTHFHLIVKQLRNNGISSTISKMSNSYARYLNTKIKRHGPLWMGRFKSVLIVSDEQLLHVTRYLHLNPTTANLVKAPEDWPWSSYAEYINPNQVKYPLCQFSELMDIKPGHYRKFAEDHKNFQKELGKIKQLILE